MAHVFRTNGTETSVKNLGWLIRHAADATSIGLYANGLNGNEASLVVTGDGWVFYSPFASAEVAEDWVKRPALAGVPAVVNYRQTLTLSDLRRAGAAS